MKKYRLLIVLMASLLSGICYAAPVCYTATDAACTPGTSNCYRCTPESCSSAHINAAIVAVQQGGTVNVPAGDCTLLGQLGNYTSTTVRTGATTYRVELTKSIRILGQGTNCPASAYPSGSKGTCLTADFRTTGLSPGTPLIYYRPSAQTSYTHEVGNLSFDTGYEIYPGTNGSNCSYSAALFDGEGHYQNTIRYHHMNMLNTYRPFYSTNCNTKNWPSFLSSEGNNFIVRYMTGVIDHCYVTGSAFADHGRWGGGWARAYLNPWAQGTGANLFIENNYIKKTLQPSIMQFTLSDQGGSAVWRYNTFDYTDPSFTGTFFYPVDTHGHQAGPTMSAFGGEYYGNHVITKSGQNFNFLDHRGSRAKIFNNVSNRAGAGSVRVGNLWDDLAQVYGATSPTGYYATLYDGMGLCLDDGVTYHPGYYACSTDAERRPQHVNQTYVWNNRDVNNAILQISIGAGPLNYIIPSTSVGLLSTPWDPPNIPTKDTHVWIDYKTWTKSALQYGSDSRHTCIIHGYGTATPDPGWESCPSTGLPRTPEEIQGDKARTYNYSNPVNITLSNTQTHGVACGTAAQRQAITTCTKGVGFWEVPNASECTSVPAYGNTVSAANKIQGTLYRCGASNNWQAFYTPYTYPHPLVTGDAIDTSNPIIQDSSLLPSGVQECSGDSGNYTLYATATDNVGVSGLRSCLAGESCNSSTVFANMDMNWTNAGGNLWSFDVVVPCNTLNRTYYLMAADTASPPNYSTTKAIVFSTDTEQDITAPTVSGVVISADGLGAEITFSESVRIGAGGSGGFSLVDVDSNVYALTYSGPGTDSTKSLFTSDSCIPSGADDFKGVGGLLYTQPTDGIEDMSGLDLVTIGSTVDVTNSSETLCSTYSGFASLFSHDDPFVRTGGTWMRGDGLGGNVGVVFTSSIPATVLQVCFYKDDYMAIDTDPREGSLWLVSPPTLLGSVVFEETASGWQCQDLPAPVNINAGTQYEAALHLDARFIYISYFFSSEYVSDFTDGTLTVPASGGRYSSEAPLIMPAGVSTRNYGVDIVMTYGTEPEEGPWSVNISKVGSGCVFQETGENITTDDGETASVNIVLKPGWKVSWGGTCGGSAEGNTYTTSAVTANCTVIATCSKKQAAPWVAP